MGGERCELCGHVGKLGAAATHRIVPREFTSQAGMPDSATVPLCRNCRREVHAWYSKKVFGMAYDATLKRFRPRSSAEMVKEYEAVYRVFARYKKREHQRA